MWLVSGAYIFIPKSSGTLCQYLRIMPSSAGPSERPRLCFPTDARAYPGFGSSSLVQVVRSVEAKLYNNVTLNLLIRCQCGESRDQACFFSVSIPNIITISIQARPGEE